MTDLREVAPEIEKKLRHISHVLEQASLFRRLNEWLVMLEEVRRLASFQDFRLASSMFRSQT
jgi:hypothetical protein